jgi:hypothetical protein
MQKFQSLIRDKPILFLLSLAFCLRIYNVQSPILGVHSWRQADTAVDNIFANRWRVDI